MSARVLPTGLGKSGARALILPRPAAPATGGGAPPFCRCPGARPGGKIGWPRRPRAHAPHHAPRVSSAPRRTPATPAPTSVRVWIDQVADRFESAWQTGTPPRLADFLGTATGETRLALLEELVRIDLAYRRLAGE